MSINYYNIELPKLDLTKPIGCKFKSDGEISVLIPQIKKDGSTDPYKIEGYNWFNFLTGQYTSAVFYESIDTAIKAREDYQQSYELFNVDLKVLLLSN